MGYHTIEIPRGTYGEISKVVEETTELVDAESQKNKVMVLIELSDIIGAIDGYLENKYNGSVSLEDLIIMAKATKRAFQSGERVGN